MIARRADAEIITQGPGNRFVTAVLACLNTSTGELSYLVAGHPPPLLLRANRTVKALQYGRRVPLGISGRDVEVAHEHLEPGDRLLLYTDGITEARDARGRPFGTDRLIAFAERSGADGLPAPETLRRLAHDVLEHQGGLLQDDTTLLMVDWRPVNPSVVRQAPVLDGRECPERTHGLLAGGEPPPYAHAPVRSLSRDAVVQRLVFHQ